mgnify:FL=1
MKRKYFLKKLAKIFKKKSMGENDRVELDSLNFLEILDLNDLNFKNLNIPVNKFRKCKTTGDLIKLYGNKIN